jgi:SPX domain protein involved in polyphosphate accumulation
VVLEQALSDYMKPDAYNLTHETYPICNIYYDTPDSLFIRTSLEKPCYKEKLRLRSYGTPGPDGKAYVELKKKFRGVVNKRRSALPLHQAYTFLQTGRLPALQPGMNAQVLREIAYLLSQRELRPALYLAYQRRAYFSIDDPDLRVSFDKDIHTRRSDLLLESGVYGESLLPQGQWVMEIKAAHSYPLWLAHLLAEHAVYPISFSKYGQEYQKHIARREELCLSPFSAPLQANPIFRLETC